MKERPVGFEEVATTDDAVPLPPGATARMAVRAQIAPSGSAIIVTLRSGTLVLRGGHLTPTPTRGAPQGRRAGGALRGRRRGVFTGGTAGHGGETRKRLRVLQMPRGAFGGLVVSLAGGGLAP